MTYEANIKEFMDKKKKKKKKKIILFTLNDFFISYITTLYGNLTKLYTDIQYTGTTCNTVTLSFIQIYKMTVTPIICTYSFASIFVSVLSKFPLEPIVKLLPELPVK